MQNNFEPKHIKQATEKLEKYLIVAKKDTEVFKINPKTKSIWVYIKKVLYLN